MSSAIAENREDVALAQVGSDNATALLPSPEEVSLQELWLRIFDMTEGASSDGPSTPSSDPLALPHRPRSPRIFRRSRTMARPPNAPPTPGPSRTRKKRKGNNDHLRMSPTELREGMYDAMRSNQPDWWLSYFLRANDYEVDGTVDDMLRHVHWRRSVMDIDGDILPNGEAGALRTKNNPQKDLKERRVAEGFLNILDNNICRILNGRDYEGKLMGIVNVRNHRRGQYPVESYERYIAWHCETVKMMMADGFGDGTIIFDFLDYKVVNMDYRPIKSIIQIMKDFYPQMLSGVILHRAPPLIMSVWALIKPLIREEYLAHIHLTKDESDLERFMPLQSIPEALGGGDKSSFDYEYPDLNEPANGGGGREVQAQWDHERVLAQHARKEVIRLFEETTQEWVNASQKGRDNRGLQSLRDKYSHELVVSYWRLDPYVRAPSIYDRLGRIPPSDIKQHETVAK